jgi:hypothetical protein
MSRTASPKEVEFATSAHSTPVKDLIETIDNF